MNHCRYDPFNPCENCGKCRRSDGDERDPDREYELARDKKWDRDIERDCNEKKRHDATG